MTRRPRWEQFAGALVGQCLGDALGFVVEGYRPEHCRRYVDGALRTGRAGEVGRAPFACVPSMFDSLEVKVLYPT